MIEFKFSGSDGKSIAAYKWLPEGRPKAVVQIVHGVIEHAARYDGFARFLNDNGMAVYANDHRGHGKTIAHKEEMGWFADKDGWNLCVDDLNGLRTIAEKEQAGIPYFFFGHSMGSFLTRTYITKHAAGLSGCILSGTAVHPKALIISGSLVAKLQALFRGKKFPSKMLSSLSFGAYNKRIKDPKTPYDWVSRDVDSVTKYVQDEYCGFLGTCGLFIDLMSGLKYINTNKYLLLIPPALPFLIFSGSEDPVGEYGKGPRELAERYKKAGITDVTLKIYQDGRHEMLNELNKEEVYNDVLHWLGSKLLTV
jgi:alpha-beta hydrolase superfamily lysophospholipase